MHRRPFKRDLTARSRFHSAKSCTTKDTQRHYHGSVREHHRLLTMHRMQLNSYAWMQRHTQEYHHRSLSNLYAKQNSISWMLYNTSHQKTPKVINTDTNNRQLIVPLAMTLLGSGPNPDKRFPVTGWCTNSQYSDVLPKEAKPDMSSTLENAVVQFCDMCQMLRWHSHITKCYAQRATSPGNGVMLSPMPKKPSILLKTSIGDAKNY